VAWALPLKKISPFSVPGKVPVTLELPSAIVRVIVADAGGSSQADKPAPVTVAELLVDPVTPGIAFTPAEAVPAPILADAVSVTDVPPPLIVTGTFAVAEVKVKFPDVELKMLMIAVAVSFSVMTTSLSVPSAVLNVLNVALIGYAPDGEAGSV
jgi:hypothetical protein